MKIPQKAVVYVRISDDREGVGAGVARQEADARVLASRLGWEVGEVIVENDTSAFKRRKVRTPTGRAELRVYRPGFRRLLDLLESGAADGMLAYDLDRTARDPRDLEDLIDVVESREPRVPVESVSGSLRLANDADVTMARVMVAVANKSSRDTKRRVARKMEEMAREGRYAGGGARRYGYEKDGVTINETEAEVIREAARRVIAGEAANAICKDLNARGIRPVSAEKWSTNSLIGILRSGRIAGLREHRGEVVGPAQWPAIIDDETRGDVLAALDVASKHKGKPSLRYWLNHGLLICSRCGGSLYGDWGSERGKHRYWCRPDRGGCGGIAIKGEGAEGEVEAQVLAYLSRPDVVSALASGASETSAAEVRRAIAEEQEQLRGLATAHGNKQISMAEWLAARAPIDERLRTYEGALRAIMPAAVRRVIEADDPAKEWEELDAHGKRQLTRVILEAGGWRGWEVAPADTTKARRFDAGRMRLSRLADSEA
ncbi:MAG TPA: recombinase family protein [Nocardioides sp.]